MATSVALTLHGLLAGKTFTPAELRSGFLSRLGVAQDGTTALKARPGILPGAGTPGAVSQASTPAMKVLVKAGSFVVVAPGSPGGTYTCSLTADTELDIATAPGSNSRWDVIGVKVFDDGTTPTCTLESVAGTAAASPALPSAITSPAADTYWFPLARVVVGTSVTTIVNANISKPAASGGLPAFGQFTAAPGGTIRNSLRSWSHTRNTLTAFTPGGGAGIVNQVSIPAADCVPGIYQASFHAMWQMAGTPDTAVSLLLLRSVTPQFTRTFPMDVRAGRFWSFSDTRTIVIDSQPSTAQVWQTTLEVSTGALNANVGDAGNPVTLDVVRIADL